MTTIALPDYQALGRLASGDQRPISEVIAEIMKDVSPEEFRQLPKDGASQVDRYVYGMANRRR